MPVKIVLTPQGLSVMKSGIPELYTGPLLPGSIQQHALLEAGHIVLQEIHQLNYTIRYNVYQFSKQFKCNFRREETGLQTTAILQDHCRKTINGAGRFKMRQGYFSSLFTRPWDGLLECSANSHLIFLDTTWSTEWLQSFLPEDSEWWKLLREKHPGIPQIIGAPYRAITPALNQLNRELIYSPYDVSLHDSRRDDLMKQYVVEVMQEVANPKWLSQTINPVDLKKIEDARDLIAADPSRHVYTKIIAREVGMNECKLKALFGKATGMGTFDYMMFLRCSAVRDRILSTDLPLKAFVKEAGYSDLANFVNGFKRHMGCTPADLRG